MWWRVLPDRSRLMRLVAESSARLSVPFEASTPSFKAEAEAEIMLKTFEEELDGLLNMVDSERTAALSDALIRRYVTAEEIYKNVGESWDRIEVKMVMLSDRLTAGISRGTDDGK